MVFGLVWCQVGDDVWFTCGVRCGIMSGLLVSGDIWFTLVSVVGWCLFYHVYFGVSREWCLVYFGVSCGTKSGLL